MHFKNFYIPLFLIALNPLYIKAQDCSPDTIFIPEGNSVFNGKDKIEPRIDTTILVFPDEKIKLKESKETRTSRFFEDMNNRADKNKWIRELHNIIVVQPSKSSDSDTLITERSVGRFVQYDGLIIHDVKIVKLDVFGINIDNDTSLHYKSFINRTGNALHIKTHDRIIQRYLLFKPGDAIDPSVLSDNERIFRELPFIEDARIIVEKIPGSDDYANIVLVIKDVWSKAFLVELRDINYVKLELFDKNIFGTGLEIQNNLHWNPEKTGTLGYEAFYKSNNVLGSFINSRLYYTNVFDTESYGFKLERKFFTPSIQYAGGTSAYYLNTIRNIWFPDSGYFDDHIKLNYFDFWLGRSFLLSAETTLNPSRLNFIIASGFLKESYFDRPDVSENSHYAFHNKTLWLNSLSLSRQSYYKSNLIYSFGRTEDVPTGYLINLVAGPEYGEFSNRFYASVNLSQADYYDRLGYLHFKAAYGGFYKKNGTFEQGLLDLKSTWFTRLLIIGQFQLRHFTSIQYLKGYERFNDEKIYINESSGIRGFSEKNIFGEQKLVINLESVIFTPLNIIGFRVAASAFADLAFLGEENSRLISGSPYAGIGLGLRIRNERLVFPTFQLRIAYYPNLPGLKIPDLIRFLGEPRLNPEKFYPDAPSVLTF